MADESVSIRVAAAADVHVRDANRDQVAEAFAALEGDADLVLVAGDLTTHGEPEQAKLFAEVCRPLSMPVLAVFGNHDCHADRMDEVRAVLEDEGVIVLERESTVQEVAGTEVGIVGLKGFVGGFAGSNLPDFGERQLRDVYATTTADVEALADGLHAIATCPYRIVLLHYSPTAETLEGEPQGIWAFLGSDRLAAPILEHAPDLVLHGHAHAGTFEGRLGESPVYNVSVPVMGRDFWIFELTTPRRPTTPIH
ncbi:MAG TPA: metallophosphoesterase [Thermoleophilaceae bacterium]|nr:metallophosphoesterase [Thermoleophilaceae bacterium]